MVVFGLTCGHKSFLSMYEVCVLYRPVICYMCLYLIIKNIKDKKKDKPLFFIELLNIIKIKVKTLIIANNMNDRISKPWQDRLDEVL